MIFEWDEDKRRKNREKHGIDFLRASRVFRDKQRIEFVDDREDYGETRVRVIGKITRLWILKTIIIFVVYTNRNGNIRIISARVANPSERSSYYGDC